MSGPPRQPPEPPLAWPLGCAVALLGLMLGFNLVGLAGILFAAAALPPWLARAGPIAAGLAVPLLLLAGALLARRRNPYAARVLLWGFAFTLVAASALTALFDTIDRLSGL